MKMYNWNEVGPIMEKYKIEPYWIGDKIHAATKFSNEVYRNNTGFMVESEEYLFSTGDTVMEAVMNCYNKIAADASARLP